MSSYSLLYDSALLWIAGLGFIAACLVVGFITIIKTLIGSPSKQKEPINQSSSPGSEKRNPINLDSFRIKIEDLYFQKKLTKEGLSDLLGFLKIKASGPSIQHAPISSEQKEKAGATIESQTPISSKTMRPSASASTIQKQMVSQTKKPSGFFSSENIKTLLISGCSLFVLSAYLFVRSFWSAIPDFLKFGALLAMSIGIYFTGARFNQKKTLPSTSETLLVLSQILIPFNIYAFNILILNNAFSAYTSWSVGFLFMFVSAFRLMTHLPTFSLGVTVGVAFQAIFIFGGLSQGVSPQNWYLSVAVSTLALCGLTFLYDHKEKSQKGLLAVFNVSCILILLGLVFRGFFLTQASHFQTALTLLVLGGIFAIQSRIFDYRFAFAAGPCFMGAGAVLLHHLQIPTYKYGLFFVPAGLLSTLRAWRFEKTNRENLAQPYFILGQISILASLLAIMPTFSFYMNQGFYTLLSILTVTTLVYGFMAFLYRNPVFTYAGGLVLLFMGGVNFWHFKLPFSIGLAYFGWIGAGFTIMGLLMRKSLSNLVGVPLHTLGLGALSLSLAAAVGQWAQMKIVGDAFILNLSMDQVSAGIKVGLMCTLTYALSAYVKKMSALFYPALVSATLVYVFVLEKYDLPINLLNISWVVIASMVLFYGAHFLKWKTIARSFAVWAQLIFQLVFIGTLLTSPSNYPAILLCALSFAPALFLGFVDLNTSFFLAVYSGHLFWFNSKIGTFHLPNHSIVYSTHLLILNIVVALSRGLIKIPRPSLSLAPYKIFIGIFSIVSLVFALQSKEHAWLVFAAYGALTFLISVFFYEKKFNLFGATFFLIAYELFLNSMNVKLVEAYSVPAGLFILVNGYLFRDNKDLSTFLYVLGQLVLYVPSFHEAMNETWGGHGIFLGVMSLALMLTGIHLRNKSLAFLSLGVLIGNGIFQSMFFLKTIPRWVYLGLGGATLVSLGGLFEFQREKLIEIKKNLVNTLEGWD